MLSRWLGRTHFPSQRIEVQNTKINQLQGLIKNVKPWKEKALFWHAVWKSAGRPLNNQLHNIMKSTRNKYHTEFKKCKKAEERVKNSKLLNACLNGNGDLFKEIKALRRTKPKFADTMDGVKGNIPGHFKDIFNELYNCVNDGEEVSKISKDIEELICDKDISHVNKVTSEEVKKAALLLKPGKGDPSYTFSSDCISVKSEILAETTATLIRSFLIHGYIPQFMLLSTLVPLVKDKLRSIHISKNCRSVCITSLFLKQFDWITVNLFGDKLGFHELQFPAI